MIVDKALDARLDAITNSLDTAVVELRRVTQIIRAAQAHEPPVMSIEETDVYDDDATGPEAGDRLLLSRVSALSDNVEALRFNVRDSEQARQRETRVGMMLMRALVVSVILLTLLTAGALVVAWQGYVSANRARETNSRISDCTTPGGRCYAESAKRTGAAVGDIVRSQIALGECSRLYPNESGPEFDRKLRQCVYDRIATDPPTPRPKSAG